MPSTVNSRYIDFHSHFYDLSWFPSPITTGHGILARAWPLLTDIEAQLAAMESVGIDAKVLSEPSRLVRNPQPSRLLNSQRSRIPGYHQNPWLLPNNCRCTPVLVTDKPLNLFMGYLT